MEALNEADLGIAEQIIKDDAKIDELEVAIDREAIRYLTLRSPVATDLRLITVAIKASHDLERVGDEARNIAKHCRKILAKGGNVEDLGDILKMAGLAEQMLRDALQGLIEGDNEKAHNVLTQDDAVDDLNKANYKRLIQRAKADPDSINRYMDLIFVSKAVERIADHATNLAEEVIFLMTAREMRHHLGR